jgi:phytoene/squalene synthetase
MAERHFADAEQAMARAARRAMRPAALMAAFYRAMLRALQREDWRPPRARVSLSTPHKLWLVLRHGFL